LELNFLRRSGVKLSTSYVNLCFLVKCYVILQPSESKAFEAFLAQNHPNNGNLLIPFNPHGYKRQKSCKSPESASNHILLGLGL
jgi:hypothetical protein